MTSLQRRHDLTSREARNLNAERALTQWRIWSTLNSPSHLVILSGVSPLSVFQNLSYPHSSANCPRTEADASPSHTRTLDRKPRVLSVLALEPQGHEHGPHQPHLVQGIQVCAGFSQLDSQLTMLAAQAASLSCV